MHTAKWTASRIPAGVSRPSREITDSLFSSFMPGAPGNAGPQIETEITGSVTRMQLRRSRVGFALDRAHDYDLLFLRALQKTRTPAARFSPGRGANHRNRAMLGFWAPSGAQAQNSLAATWQNNLAPICADAGTSAELSFLPEAWSGRVLPLVERWSSPR